MIEMDRRNFLKFTGVSLAGGLIFGCEPGEKSDAGSKPNLLFVYADEMREMAMSCSGDTNVNTPNMDRLAGEGVHFRRMYTTSPVCSPARASLLTGMYPHNAGITSNNQHLRENIPTIAEITSANDYVTAHIGKWHVHGGFKPGKKSLYGYVPKESHRGFRYWAGYEHGHDNYFGAVYYTDSPVPIKLPDDVYEPDFQTDLAIKFIEDNKNKAWHIDLSWGPPHFPLTSNQVKAEDLARHNPETITLRPNVPEKYKQEAREQLAIYYAMIENLDHNMGRLLDKMDELGLTEKTVVVFTSDHGDMMLSHGQHYKRRPQEESSRVPYLLRYPGRVIPVGSIHDLASLVDSAPTLLDLMGLKHTGMDGISHAPRLISDTSKPARDCVYMQCHQFGCRDYDPGLYMKKTWRAIRTEEYMAAFLKGDNGNPKIVQLFDMKKDPYQMNNLADSVEYAKTRTYLTQKTINVSKSCNDTWFVNHLKIGDKQ